MRRRPENVHPSSRARSGGGIRTRRFDLVWAWWREVDLARPFFGAVALVGGGLLVWGVYRGEAPAGIDPAAIVTPTFALMGGVIGHYFQSRLVQEARQGEVEAKVDKRELREVVDAYERRIERLLDELAEARRLLETAKIGKERQKIDRREKEVKGEEK